MFQRVHEKGSRERFNRRVQEKRFKRMVQENGGHLSALLGWEHRWLGEPRRLRKRTKTSLAGIKNYCSIGQCQ